MRALSDEEMMAALLGIPLLSVENQFLVHTLASEAQQAGLSLETYLRRLHAQQRENQRQLSESDSSSSRTPPQTLREHNYQLEEENRELRNRLNSLPSMAGLEAMRLELSRLPEFIQDEFTNAVPTLRDSDITPRQWAMANGMATHVQEYEQLPDNERQEYNQRTKRSKIGCFPETPRQLARNKQQKERKIGKKKDKEKKVSRSSVGSSSLVQHHQYVPTILTGGQRQIRRTNSASSQHVQQYPRARAIRNDNALEQIREGDPQSSSISPSITPMPSIMASMTPVSRVMPQPSVVPISSVLPTAKSSHSKHTHRETPKRTYSNMPQWLNPKHPFVDPHDPRNFNTWGANAAFVAVASHWLSRAGQWLFSRRMPIMFSDPRWFETLLSAIQSLQVAIRNYRPNDYTDLMPLCQQIESCVSSISQQPLILEHSMHPADRLGTAQQQLTAYLKEQSSPFSHLDDDTMIRLSQELGSIDQMVAEELSILLLDNLKNLRDQLLDTPYPNALLQCSAEIVTLFWQVDEYINADDKVLETLIKISHCHYLASLQQRIPQLQSNLAAALLLAEQMDFPPYPYDSKDVMFLAQETLPKKAFKRFLRRHKATVAYEQMQAEDISVFILINDIASPKPSLSLVRQLLNKLAQLNRNIRYSPVALTPSNKEDFITPV